MRLAVVVASLGRPEIVGRLMEGLAAQTRPPDQIVVPVVVREDGPASPPASLAVEILLSEKGLCAQRNRGLDHLGESVDIITFLDDDFIPASDYLENVERLFAADPGLAGATGAILADGVTGPGLDYEEGRRIVAARPRAGSSSPSLRPIHCLYGCNMSFRESAVRGLRFDERLPLYGWLEDVDFSVAAGRRGKLVKSAALAGVHLGVKAGRTSGVRFGYSQIVNPLYLLGKGTIPLGQAAANIFRNLAANHVRAVAPEPYIDRLGRVKGNWRAIFDVMRGKISPERVLEL